MSKHLSLRQLQKTTFIGLDGFLDFTLCLYLYLCDPIVYKEETRLLTQSYNTKLRTATSCEVLLKFE